MKIRFKPRRSKIRFERERVSPRQKAETAPRKKRRLKYIAVLPSFITLMNGACGFIAIVLASRSPDQIWRISLFAGYRLNSFVISGYMIFLAMIMDTLDGRVARLTRTTSSFGGQLDSLSDAISFGAAPAFLMMKVVEFHLGKIRFESWRFSVLVSRCIIFSAVFYTMCAVVRLARFNVENEENESAHMHFAGLPSPAAAGVIVSLVIFYRQFLPAIADDIADDVASLYRTLDVAAVVALPVITFIAGILMVSRIRYPHVPNQLLRGKKTLATLLIFFACGFLIMWNIQLAMVFGFCGFALFGIIRACVVRLFGKRPRPPVKRN